MPQPENTFAVDAEPKFDFAVLDNAEPPRSIVYETATDRPVLILGIEPTDQLAVEQIAGILNQNDVGSVMLFAADQARRAVLDDLIDDAIEQWHVGDSTEDMHTFLGWSFEEYMAWTNDRTLPKVLARLVAPAAAGPADQPKNSPPTG